MSNMKLHNASYCQDRTVIGIADLDTGTLCAGMHDQPAANIHSHMTVITDQISRLCIAVVHTGATTSLLIGRTGNAVTEITVDAEGKSGTIRHSSGWYRPPHTDYLCTDRHILQDAFPYHCRRHFR